MLRERWARQNKRDSRLARDNGQPFTIRVNLKHVIEISTFKRKPPTHYFHIQTEAPNSLFPHSNGSRCSNNVRQCYCPYCHEHLLMTIDEGED